MSEGFVRFSSEKLRSLRDRYRSDKLFRTWTRSLCLLEENYGELNAVEVWSETETIRQHLAEIKENRDNEAEFLFGMLRDRHLLWIGEKGELCTRSRGQGERTAVIILTVLFSQFSDSADSDDDDAVDSNPNRALCVALANKLKNPRHYDFVRRLMDSMTGKKVDNNGNEIILPVTNYMDEENVPHSLKECDVGEDVYKSGWSYDAVLERLRVDVFYGITDDAAAFLERIKGLKSGTQITGVVNKCIDDELLNKEQSHRKLWKVLHDAGIYTKGESNWNNQVK